ncbi:MAG: HEPN domain-containing protein [Candidatus Sericytochromatia bacterium]|nr:HEPN domain-containing protein [Candidatus Tanganyikabacteria bacterium]
MNGIDPADDAARWLRFAQEDLESAQTILREQGRAWRNACWHALQAAEKACKAVLVLNGIAYPRTHDLDRLVLLLPAEMRSLIAGSDLSWLSEWAIESRYPGDWPEAERQDAERAIAIAGRVCERAAEVLSLRGG